MQRVRLCKRRRCEGGSIKVILMIFGLCMNTLKTMDPHFPPQSTDIDMGNHQGWQGVRDSCTNQWPPCLGTQCNFSSHTSLKPALCKRERDLLNWAFNFAAVDRLVEVFCPEPSSFFLVVSAHAETTQYVTETFACRMEVRKGLNHDFPICLLPEFIDKGQ